MSDQVHEWTDDRIDELSSRMREMYEQAAREMREKLDSWLDDYEKKRKAWEDDVSKGVRTKDEYDAWLKGRAADKSWQQDMIDQLSMDAVNADMLARQAINDELPNVYAENANYAAYDIDSQAGIWTGFTLYDADTIRNLAMNDPELLPKRELDAAKDFAWNSRKFNSAMTQGILQGESIPNISKRLMGVMDMDRRAATLAARTACTAAESMGRQSSYRRAQSMGIGLRQQWLATLDMRTRHTHRLLDKQTVNVGEKFCPKGYGEKHALRFPADPRGLPEEVYACRCTTIAVLDDEDYEGDERWSKLPDGMTYEEWKGLTKDDNKSESGVHAIVNGKDLTQTFKPSNTDPSNPTAIREIIHRQGFDGKPEVVSRDEFDRRAAAANGGKGLIMQRAYGSPTQEVLDAYQRELYEGDFYVDCSGGHMYGRGMYASFEDGITPSKAMEQQSARYAKSHGAKFGRVETMTLDPSAKIIEYNSLSDYWEDERIPKWMREGDDGVLATALGYDAIRVNNAREMVVLNRTKLIIRGEE